MAAKKTKAAIAVGPNGTKHTLATHVDEGLWRAFKDFREQRKENRNFPWATRDCMEIAIKDYLDKYSDED